MADRVTQDEVKAIIETDVVDISPFITVANLLVTNKLGNEGLSTELLKEIERWLSAHFVAIRDPRLAKEKIGDVENTYLSKVADDGLKTTTYGMQVEILDTTGILSNLSKKKTTFKAIKSFED